MNAGPRTEPILTDTHKAAVYLIACALGGTVPEESYTASIDHESLYKFAVSQNIDAMLGWVLSRTGCGEMAARWKSAYDSSVRKTMLFDAERARVLSFLEEKGIWYMPLKGILIKNLYPVYGMRQMADNDILFNSEYAETVKDYFISHGYKCTSFAQSNHDVYEKKPVFNFEMHRTLFGKSSTYYEYCLGVKDRLIQNTGTAYGYHFSNGDFYIYIYLHFAKHLHGSGTGIRAFTDLYLYRTRHPDLNSSYISGELDRFGLGQEERFVQGLARKLFAATTSEFLSLLNQEEKDFLLQFLTNGTYGTAKTRLSNALNQYDESSGLVRKLHYIKDRLLPDIEEKLPFYPAIFSRHRWTRPFFYIYRIFNRMIIRGKRIWNEIKLLVRL